MAHQAHTPHRGDWIQMTADYLSDRTFGRFGRITRRQPAGAMILLFGTAADPEPKPCFYSLGAYTPLREAAIGG